MRLLLVIDSLTSGGAQRQLVNLATGLASRAHEVRVFAYHDIDFFGPQLREAGVEILLHPKRSKFETRVVRQLAGEISAGGYDAVVSFLTVPNIYSVLATRINASKPVLVVSHRASAVGDSFRWRDRLATRIYQWADAVTVNSHHMRAFLAQRHPPLRDRLTTIWNGVDVERFGHKPRPHPGETLRLLTIGDMTPGKQWDVLVDAVRILHAQHVDVRVTHVGAAENSPEGEKPYAARIRQRLDDAGVSQSWNWLGRRTDIAELLHEHDALVHPSTAEGLPNVVCEALACGCPPIVANTLDHPLLVQDGETGFLFTPGDAKDLARTLNKFHESSNAARQAMGHAGRKFALERLSLETYADAWEELLERLLKERAARKTRESG